MKNICLAFCFILPCFAFSQTQNDTNTIWTPLVDTTLAFTYTPYNPSGKYQTWAVKGKVLPWTIANTAGVNVLFGVEHCLFKNHSLGLDLFFNGQESTQDALNNAKPPIPAKDFVEYNKAIFINYRYYPPFTDLRENKGLLFYIGLFANYGHLRDMFDRGYSRVDRTDSTIVFNSYYYSKGVIIGSLIKFKKKKRIHLDINLGFYNSNADVYAISGNNHLDLLTKDHFNTYRMRMGLNLYWVFFHSPRRPKQQ